MAIRTEKPFSGHREKSEAEPRESEALTVCGAGRGLQQSLALADVNNIGIWGKCSVPAPLGSLGTSSFCQEEANLAGQKRSTEDCVKLEQQA